MPLTSTKSFLLKRREKILGWGELLGDDEKISMEKNDMLEADFTESGIKKVIDGSYAEEAPGLDGLHLCFIKKIGQQLRMILWI
jgi:hypothetical protein